MTKSPLEGDVKDRTQGYKLDQNHVFTTPFPQPKENHLILTPLRM